MLHLLKIEWLKVKNYKAFWIFTILYAFAIVGINYTGLYINELTVQNIPMGKALMGSPYTFPKVWGTVGYMSSWLLYFPGILFLHALILQVVHNWPYCHRIGFLFFRDGKYRLHFYPNSCLHHVCDVPGNTVSKKRSGYCGFLFVWVDL